MFINNRSLFWVPKKLLSSNQIICNKKHKPEFHHEAGEKASVNLHGGMGAPVKSCCSDDTCNHCKEHQDGQGLQMKVTPEAIENTHHTTDSNHMNADFPAEIDEEGNQDRQA